MTSKDIPRILTQQFFGAALNFASAQVTFLALIAFLQGFGILSITAELSRVVWVLTGLNLASAPILKRRLYSPKIHNPACNQCGSKKMLSTGLVCVDCGSQVGPPQIVKDILDKKGPPS